MSRSEIKVGARTESSEYIDMDFSSGDSNKMKPKQFYREENNNEADELSKDFTEMGCIVDAVKRPPNICVETCVYEDSDSGNDKSEVETKDNEDDIYSDEFEEDKSEIEEATKERKEQSKSEHNIIKETPSSPPLVKLSKSLSNSSTNKQLSSSAQSTNYGSISIPPTRRVNMSFTNERLREIERHNHILLNKILSARNSRKSSIPPREQPARNPVPAAAVHRKLQQKKIDHDNMILLKKIQRAKSSACSLRR
ncbi:PREDICTED: cilia- and flagella-associated protein 97-like [Papilio polytes]|uniref:cilia- and flagella-associated protein 97-like n=1 Tax=Papilio polytes TaxID=76194 RepID=UPI000675DDF3|nr:PREDICTED: cilia- and flagella-associated protein 97-like [Papilio polytes]